MAKPEFRIENLELRKMTNQIQSIPLAQLKPHPDNPNRMSKVTFAKLLRNIKQTGRYEPLIVRQTKDKCHIFPKRSRNYPKNTDSSDISHRNKSHYTRKTTDKREDLHINPRNDRKTTGKNPIFEIINGHHRWLALKQLGKSHADVIVWDVDDGQVDVLLATLNRLSGCDVLDKKLALLKRLTERTRPAELAKLLPQTKKQIEKLIQLNSQRLLLSRRGISEGPGIANPLVFFVSDSQQQTVVTAIDNAMQNEKSLAGDAGTKAARRAAALSVICKSYLDNVKKERADA